VLNHIWLLQIKNRKGRRPIKHYLKVGSEALLDLLSSSLLKVEKLLISCGKCCFLLSKVSKEKVAAFDNDGDDDATEF
jgi:hypothetical protein